MYKLKTIPRDFIVEEVPSFDQNSLSHESKGKYLYLKLRKENWNTLSAVQKIAKALEIDSKDINFAGTKDKNAITSQFVSVNTKGKPLLEKFPLTLPSGISVECLGYSTNPLSLGNLGGNKFTITIRNLEEKDSVVLCKRFVNYFDEQRFSIHNVSIGRYIVKKNFAKAASLVDDPRVKEQLSLDSKDSVKALQLLPRKLLMLYIHAYQSYLWNETVSRYLRIKFGESQRELTYSQGELVLSSDSNLSNLVDVEIPLIGALPLSDSIDSEVIKIIETLLAEEKLSRYDFIIKQFSNITPEGGMRNLVCSISQLKIGKKEVDELHDSMWKQKISFVLSKGSYATMFVKFLIQKQKK